MSRFIFPGKYAMRLNTKGTGPVLAFFTVVDTLTGIEFRDARLIEGKNGVFVGAPFREWEKTNEDGSTEKVYSDFWRPAYDENAGARNETGVATVEAMAQAAYAKYLEIKGGKSSGSGVTREESRGGRSGGQQQKPARGRVSAPLVDEDDGLPF